MSVKPNHESLLMERHEPVTYCYARPLRTAATGKFVFGRKDTIPWGYKKMSRADLQRPTFYATTVP